MRERSVKQNYGTYLALDGMIVSLGMILELLELKNISSSLVKFDQTSLC